jgi:molybdopterin-binding protein
MKISARNQIAGTVVAITPGAVNGTVKVNIGGGNVTRPASPRRRSPISRWRRAIR